MNNKMVIKKIMYHHKFYNLLRVCWAHYEWLRRRVSCEL